ncbi:Carbohydrate-binding module family 1 protein/glycoside hydrolase family 5 protein [Mycena kentingensis (nom. inval.)]|nr:Carbohydrate-binding module family 1 protein/glycoside hydrolase family 5 protein [Mycena kentingensis (nom. inval.)]
MIRSTLLLAAICASTALAQSPVFGQCGGTGWTGATTCATGSTCIVQNAFFFQCVPNDSIPPSATLATPTSTVSRPTSTVSSSRTTSSTTVSRTTTTSVPAQTGFVTTSGKRFMLNGAKYTVVGSNAYWPGLLGYNAANVNQAFADMAASGATTIRTWAFCEVTNANFIYLQLWNGRTATLNTGATGLQVLDAVVASAKAHGLRLIMVLTNNWSDFGGMDIYTAQLVGSGQPHDLFYTNPTIISAFQNYVRQIVTHYVNEPTIMAWELANEPRCGGSNTQASANCTVATITQWARTMSAFIKGIDRNHLVAIGDEGFFNQPGSHNFDFVYQGTLGIDFAANIQISTVDFGTFHMYPQSWGHEGDPVTWGVQWITDHATVMNSANKPVIIEEFGLIQNPTRNVSYSTWYDTMLNTGITGDLLWQAGSMFPDGQTPDDGYMIFPSDPVYALLQRHAAALKARA